MGVQVTLIHVCRVMGKEADEHREGASALPRVLPHRHPVSRLPWLVAGGGALPPIPAGMYLMLLCYIRVLLSTVDMYFQKDFIAKYI